MSDSSLRHSKFRPNLRFLSVMVVAITGMAMGTAWSPLQATDVVLVCPDAFRDAIRSWVDYRTQDGLTVSIVPSDRSAGVVQRSVRQASDASTKYVVLVGDAPTYQSPCDPSVQVPTHYVDTTVTRNWGSTADVSTDLPYGQFSEQGPPQAAVGRLPVNSREQLVSLIQRIKAYEQSDDFGDWRRRIELTAGVGGFGLLADTAIESVSRAIITGVLPTDTKTSIAYASPGHRFYPAGNTFRDAVIDRYNQGARFWVYAGHGWIDQLDRVPATPQGIPVLDARSIGRLNRPASVAPIALVLACYTGAFDASQACLAEDMLLHERGPIAVIAGSRVTMPYGNITAAIGLIDGIFQQRLPRLGDAWINMLAAMDSVDDTHDRSTMRKLIDGLAMIISPSGTKLSDERHEHMSLYNLLGDPTLRLRPPAKIQLTAKSGHLDGQPLELVVNSPVSGRLRIDLDLPLGTTLPKALAQSNEQRDDSLVIVQRDPHHWTLHSRELVVQGNAPTVVRFALPETFRGQVICRAIVSGEGSWGTGSTTVFVDPAMRKNQ